MQIKSKKITETQTYLYQGSFEIERQGTIKEIKDEFVTNENIATERAKAEFLEYGYTKQEVEFMTYFTDISINDIIRIYAPSYRIPSALNNDRFIVKGIKIYFDNGTLKTKIKAVRYD
jgi:hypothetical protein